uniref:Uncharacterized protein n=1 Tax=Craspedostauros australis TaxID=1486917 RepID=A0A7R9ZPJ9_9STRA|mmetsp:Transcript_3697/g.9803  ORF Transcript_3697/g.9803 Transcript_3697/m.9803 type:complete len:357 (+) Transcript_3697:282-1352(+)|eukprot:CAMPEP_0198115288 /NCGR_PEP_ID=MMETSP1442-20131203/6444_1 /TAXON_ID= /ORGANISM="Craspedostauros australis, Strain CCMP3328" /LENGTH=356 /DNA_ID=CAMNT_0043772777 /DNA_START=244 /DNA_END=1314 /DNA_ORIENTATION=+
MLLSRISSTSIKADTTSIAAGASVAAIAAYLLLRKARSGKTKADPNDERKRLVVVSGCDRGFGRVLVEKLSQNPRYMVLALTLKEESATMLNKLAPESLVAMKCDVTSDVDIARMEKKAATMVVDPNIVLHTIVNNAGILDPGDFVWFRDISSYKKTMDVNFFGCLRVTKALLPLMINTSMSLPEGARILNLSSIIGKLSWGNMSTYSASKYAVEAWSDSLRMELSTLNICVVKIRPSAIKTDMMREYFDRIDFNLENAPKDVKAMYDAEKVREWKNTNLAEHESRDMTGNQSAGIVVGTLAKFIETDIEKLPASKWVGAGANTVFRLISWLPESSKDKIFMRTPFYVPPIHPKQT